MSGWERYLWFAGTGTVAILASWGIAVWFDLDEGQRVLVRLVAILVLAAVAAPLFKRRGGYRD